MSWPSWDMSSVPKPCVLYITIAVFVDVKAAFDSVEHEDIRTALKTIGVGGRMYAWLSDYLSDRQIYMSTKYSDTAPHSVSHGVPHGGILTRRCATSALLEGSLPPFIEISLYADDVCIWCSGRNRRILRASLQKAINSMAAFLAARGLEIAAEKSARIAFTRRDLSRYPLTLTGVSIPYVEKQIS